MSLSEFVSGFVRGKAPCTPEYVKARKEELIAQELKKTVDEENERKRVKDIIASRNGTPQRGDLLCEISNYSGHRYIVVAEVYKNVVIGTDWYCENPYIRPIKLGGTWPCYSAWRVSDLSFISPHECVDYSKYIMGDLQLKRVRFLIDIKKLPVSVYINLPVVERKAIDQIAEECGP